MAKKLIKLDYDPQPKQALLHKCKAKQILFGGAAGGGKSHSGRWDIIGFCLENPGLNAFVFRRSLPELDGNHIQPMKKELPRSEEHTSELQSQSTISYAVFCLKKKKYRKNSHTQITITINKYT